MAGQPTLRVGYINVRGLSPEKWGQACKILEALFDFLFLAETWFVERATGPYDRRLVCTSVRPPKPVGGRYGGGIYLLATAAARSLLTSKPCVTTHSVSFTAVGLTISAVYLPPSMDVEVVNGILSDLCHSSVVLGDINTRFPGISAGRNHSMGPPDRIRVFAEFQQKGHYRLLEPTLERKRGLLRGVQLRKRLAVDHCFVARSVADASLAAFSNDSLGLDTDHDYTLGVFIGSSQKHVDTEPKQALRYAISRLAQESTRRAVQRAFTEECRGQQRAFYRHERVDVLDAWLLGLCHRVCHNELGYAATGFTQRRGHRRRRPESSTLLQDRQHADASIRLYKLANATSEQNAPILPSEDAATRGETALDELREMFARRYTAENVKQPMTNCTRLEPPPSWSVEDVAGEIRRQSSNKSAGGDGIHMLFMKALLSTCFIDLLCALFNECLKQRRTPSRWNETEIHLLVKDKTRRRDALNVRPITLICMFRKVFEKLLLARIEGSPWAVLHPAQAGFRRHYSTSVNAAIVHYALASKSARFALFLDLKSAFDVLDHNILASRLRRKHCPDTIFDLIAGLGFHGLRSRVIVNGEASSWFPRTRGVLQGSPISPFLFNIYIDPLIEGLNLLSGRIPKSLFYADDGVILVETYEELQALLDQTNKWMVENGIEINVAKCGLVATDRNGGDTIQINGQVVPVADSYPYLGFPVSAKGIDFPRFLTMRMTKARNAARWLDRFSETWGPTHRLRVYRQYFAPIWEYGAPLAAAWSLERSTFGPCLPNADAFEDATRLHGDVITWVAGCGQNLSGVAGNLLGIPKLQLRFNHLRCAFWRRLLNSPVTNPLRALMLHPLMVGYGTRFLKALDASAEWIRILSLDDGSRSIESTFRCWQDYELRAAIALVGKAYKLTRHIPMASRGRGGLPYSDISLSAPTRHQQDLLRYRLGIFQIRR